MKAQVRNGVFDARMCKERSEELYSLQPAGSSLGVTRVRTVPFPFGQPGSTPYQRPTQTVLKFIGCLAVLCEACFTSAAERFLRISTDIELVRYEQVANTAQEKRRHYPATVITSTNRWSIETKFLSNADETFYFDGTNVYRWLKITQQAPQPSLIPGKPYLTSPSPNDENVQVTINPGDHPLGNMGVNVPWLVYCSGSYLRKPGRIIPKPGGEIRGSLDAYGYLDKTEVFDDALGVPRRLSLYTSMDQLKKSYDDPITRIPGISSEAAANTGIEDGILVLTYSVEKATNYLGFNIPIEFTMTQLKRRNNGKWTPDVGASGKAASIEEVESPVDSPFPEKKYTYVDYRFHHGQKLVNAIVYSSSNYSIPPTTDAKLTNLYVVAVARAKTDPILTASRRNAIRTILILCIIVPLSMILYMSKKRKAEIREEK